MSVEVGVERKANFCRAALKQLAVHMLGVLLKREGSGVRSGSLTL